MAIVDGMMVSTSNKMYSDQTSYSEGKSKKLSSMFSNPAPKIQKWSNGAGVGKTDIFKPIKEEKSSNNNSGGDIPLEDVMGDMSSPGIAFGGISSSGNFSNDINHLGNLNSVQSNLKNAVGLNNPVKLATNVARTAISPASGLMGIATNFVTNMMKSPEANKWQTSANQRASTKNWKGASKEELFLAPPGTRIPTRLSATTNKYGGKECAEWVNDVTGAGLGSSYQSKLAKMTSRVGKIGSIAVWQPSSNPVLQKYGHTGIIVGDDGKGNWLIKSSNMKVDGSISIDKVPKSKIDGYRDTNLGRLIGGSSTPTQTPPQTQQENVAKPKAWQNSITKNLAPVQQTALTSFENIMGAGVWATKMGSTILAKVNNGDFTGAGSIIKRFVSGATPQERQQRNLEAKMLSSHDRSMSGRNGNAQ